MARSLGARPGLVALAVAVPVAELIVLQAVGFTSGLALALQAGAPGALGALHDLRWLMVFHHGWPSFAGGMLLLLVLRTALTAAFVLLAWPSGSPRPSTRRVTVNALAATALAVVLLTPAAAFLFTAAVVELYQFFLIALVVGAIPILLLSHTCVPGRWWRRLPPGRAVAWTALDAAALTLGSLALVAAPAWVTVLPTIAVGLFQALAWYAITDAAARRLAGSPPPPHPGRPVSLKPATVLIGATVVAAGAAFGIALAVSSPSLHRQALAVAEGHGRPVLDAKGFRSHFGPGSRPYLPPGFAYRRFSYRGLDAHGRPLPYAPRDTYQSLARSARLMAAQVAALHRATHRPVAILADSEGAMVAKRYLLTRGRSGPPVDELIMTSPIVRPGRVYYPPAGRSGFGVATRFALAREAQLVRLFEPIHLDTPLLRSMVDDAALLRPGMLCAIPGVRQAVLLPLVNAIAEPPPVRSAIPLTVLPALHGRVEQTFRDAVILTLAGRPIPRYPEWRIAATMVRGAAATWQAPSLPLRLDPSMVRHPDAVPAGCR